MEQTDKAKRLENIRCNLKKGDIHQIAILAKVSRVWVSLVVHGHGVSEPVMKQVEKYLAERDNK